MYDDYHCRLIEETSNFSPQDANSFIEITDHKALNTFPTWCGSLAKLSTSEVREEALRRVLLKMLASQPCLKQRYEINVEIEGLLVTGQIVRLPEPSRRRYFVCCTALPSPRSHGSELSRANFNSGYGLPKSMAMTRRYFRYLLPRIPTRESWRPGGCRQSSYACYEVRCQ